MTERDGILEKILQRLGGLDNLLTENEKLREQEKWLRVSLQEQQDMLFRRADTIMHWAKQAVTAKRLVREVLESLEGAEVFLGGTWVDEARALLEKSNKNNS